MSRPETMEALRSLSQAAADDPTPERIRARLEWLMADKSSVTDELVEIRRAIYARAGFANSMRHILCLQDPEVRLRNRITDDELLDMASPTLVVWTSDDPLRTGQGRSRDGRQDSRRSLRADHRRRPLAAVGAGRPVQQTRLVLPGGVRESMPSTTTTRSVADAAARARRRGPHPHPVSTGADLIAPDRRDAVTRPIGPRVSRDVAKTGSR